MDVSIHLEAADDDVVWWADSPNAPGLSVAAASLSELMALVEEAITAHYSSPRRVRFRLVDDESQTANVAPFDPASDPGSHWSDPQTRAFRAVVVIPGAG